MLLEKSKNESVRMEDDCNSNQLCMNPSIMEKGQVLDVVDVLVASGILPISLLPPYAHMTHYHSLIFLVDLIPRHSVLCVEYH